VKSFNGTSELSSWMYRVGLNTAIVFFKQEKRKPAQEALFDNEAIAYEHYDDHKDQQLVHFYEAVKRLNKIEKAIILQLVEGFSGKEIAANLGMSEGNVRVKTKRTKDKLQEIIKTQGYEF
jgi:RNA polymerase sigma-70 factor (ECF subfamily)